MTNAAFKDRLKSSDNWVLFSISGTAQSFVRTEFANRFGHSPKCEIHSAK